MKLIKIILLIPCFILGLSLQSCKKKKTTVDDPSPASTNGTLMLHLHTNIDTNEVENYGEVYIMSGNRKVSVNLAQLYISGIQLVKIDGSLYDVPNLTILKLMEVEEYFVGSVPSGNYRSIRFNVGLSPTTNTTTPAANDSTLNKSNMLFGNTTQSSGHVFLNFQGKIDTSKAAGGTIANMQPFQYRIGTNANLKNIVMPDQNYSVLPGQTQFIHLTIDYSQLFKNIKLDDAANLIVNSTADNNSTLARQLLNNIPSMFSYEE